MKSAVACEPTMIHAAGDIESIIRQGSGHSFNPSPISVENSEASRMSHANAKLSKLQKQILVLALGSKQRESRAFENENGADVWQP